MGYIKLSWAFRLRGSWAFRLWVLGVNLGRVRSWLYRVKVQGLKPWRVFRWGLESGCFRYKRSTYNDGESWRVRVSIFCLPWVYRRARRDSRLLRLARDRGTFVKDYDLGILEGDPFEVDYPAAWDYISWDYDYPDSVDCLLDIAGVSAGYYRGPGLDYLSDPEWGFRSWFRVVVRQSGGLDI